MGDVLRAACGVVIRVEVLDKATGRPAAEADVRGIKLEALGLNGRALEGLAGVQVSESDLEKVAILTNSQGQPLLASSQAEDNSVSGALRLALSGSEARLSDIRLTGTVGIRCFGAQGQTQVSQQVLIPTTVLSAGSSEAILQGQRPHFALLVRAIHADTGRRLSSIPPLVSEGFVVATPRVRSATKKDIPHITDHVSKLNALGKATQLKLMDLSAAAAEANAAYLQLPFSSVSTGKCNAAQGARNVHAPHLGLPLNSLCCSFCSRGVQASGGMG